MRRATLLVAAVVVLVVVFAAPSVAGPGSSDPFKGGWKATDLDGSAMTLAISGGGATRHVTWFDLSCGACDPSGYPTIALGSGEVVGNTLYATVRWNNVPGGTWSEEVSYEFVAQLDGTLWDGTFIWFRAGS